MRFSEKWTERRLETVYRRTFGLTAPRYDAVSRQIRMSRLTRAIFTGVALEGSVRPAAMNSQRVLR